MNYLFSLEASGKICPNDDFYGCVDTNFHEIFLGKFHEVPQKLIKLCNMLTIYADRFQYSSLERREFRIQVYTVTDVLSPYWGFEKEIKELISKM